MEVHSSLRYIKSKSDNDDNLMTVNVTGPGDVFRENNYGVRYGISRRTMRLTRFLLIVIRVESN